MQPSIIANIASMAKVHVIKASHFSKFIMFRFISVLSVRVLHIFSFRHVIPRVYIWHTFIKMHIIIWYCMIRYVLLYVYKSILGLKSFSLRLEYLSHKKISLERFGSRCVRLFSYGSLSLTTTIRNIWRIKVGSHKFTLKDDDDNDLCSYLIPNVSPWNFEKLREYQEFPFFFKSWK